jgi:hypothetical protein
MIYTRKDGKCKAEVIAVRDDSILIRAFWPSAKGDDRNRMRDGMTYNTLSVSRDYFNRKYGVLSHDQA